MGQVPLQDCGGLAKDNEMYLDQVISLSAASVRSI